MSAVNSEQLLVPTPTATTGSWAAAGAEISAAAKRRRAVFMLILAGPLADGVIERTAERFELCFEVEAFFAGISRRLFDRVAVLAVMA
jgi:hypothetical protein